jgi:hypothetical protein
VATLGLVRSGAAKDDPAVLRALDCSASLAQKEASAADPQLQNYQTAVALLVVLKANGDTRFDNIVAQAEAFLESAPHTSG